MEQVLTATSSAVIKSNCAFDEGFGALVVPVRERIPISSEMTTRRGRLPAGVEHYSPARRILGQFAEQANVVSAAEEEDRLGDICR